MLIWEKVYVDPSLYYLEQRQVIDLSSLLFFTYTT